MHIGWDYLDNGQMVATFAVLVKDQIAPNLYTTPPAQPAPVQSCYCLNCEALSKELAAAQRQWVGLTDEEVMQTMSGDWTSQFYFARAIEAKLKEKNNG
jgi:hypothetical protein